MARRWTASGGWPRSACGWWQSAGERAMSALQGPRRCRDRGNEPAHVPPNGRTVINEQASLNLASELLGHTDPKVTI
jgi:hypothetical protein